jgi:hypothetical protein
LGMLETSCDDGALLGISGYVFACVLCIYSKLCFAVYFPSTIDSH